MRLLFFNNTFYLVIQSYLVHCSWTTIWFWGICFILFHCDERKTYTTITSTEPTTVITPRAQNTSSFLKTAPKTCLCGPQLCLWQLLIPADFYTVGILVNDSAARGRLSYAIRRSETWELCICCLNSWNTTGDARSFYESLQPQPSALVFPIITLVIIGLE